MKTEMEAIVDKHIGARIRARRVQLGYSQTDLADFLSVTFQQIQKYENGKNRVSASRLVSIAAALRTPVTWFLEGISFDGPVDEPELHNSSHLRLAYQIKQLPPQQSDALSRFVSALGTA